MNRFKLALISFCMMSGSAHAFDFENTTCSVVKTKSKSTPSVITAIKLGNVKSLTAQQAEKIGRWNQMTDSMEFINVDVYINNGKVNRSFYRVVDGTLHQSFPSSEGLFTFRRIVPSSNPQVGRYDQVDIKGSSLKRTFLTSIVCEKNLF